MGTGEFGHGVGGVGDEQLRLRVRRREEWHLLREHSDSVFCPTSTPPAVGRAVRVDIAFAHGPRFLLRGKTTWRRTPGSDARCRSGAGICVDESDHSTLDFIDAWASGTLADRRRCRRLPVRLPVAYRAGGRRWMNFTRDMSSEGLFIRSVRLLDAGESVELRLMGPGGAPTYNLAGRVVHRVADEHLHGVGIELLFADADVQTNYEIFVEKLERELLAGQLPREVLP